jgi:oligoribonuclease NrnB/cAMP/cGMP phosphodiesterase (DHH superfamily)
MIGIYHSKDLDGYCCGAIMKHKYPEIKLIGWDYGDDIPDIPDGETVIMGDISFPMETMKEIGERCLLIWVDHHISAIKAYEEMFPLSSPFEAVLNSKIAACEIMWGRLFSNQFMPETVYLLGAYDSWRNKDKHEWDNIILPFQYGMRLICNSPKNFPVESFDTMGWCENVIHSGRTILEYQKQQNEVMCRKASFEIEFKGYKAICLNGGSFNSLTFDSIYNPEKHDIMMPFQFNGKKWNVSCYSTKDNVDCSEIAKSMGGGGHKGAAGFQVDNISEIIGDNSNR